MSRVVRLLCAVLLLATGVAIGGVSPVSAAAGPGSIAGVVTDSLGHPLAGVQYWTGYQPYGGPVTDANGAYEIDNLNPGSQYAVSFHDSSGVHADLTTAPVTVLDSGPATQDATLPDASLDVHGVVTDADGNPLAGVRVSDQNQYWVQVTTSPTGEYGLSNLGAGLHNLTADPSQVLPQFRSATLTDVDVQSGSTTEADFVLPRYATVSVTVTGNGAPVPAAGQLWPDTPFGYPQYATSDASGNMSFNVPTDGDYYLMIDSQTPDFAGEFYPHAVDAAHAQRIHIAGEQHVHLDASLPQSAVILGTVINPDGTPGSSYDVEARPVGLPEGQYPPFQPCNQPLDTDPPGTFRIGCLNPSTQYVVKGYGLGVADNTYYRNSQSAANATPITVAAGQTTRSITLKLRPLTPDPTFTGMSKLFFLTGSTTTNVHIFGTNLPSDPNALQVQVDQWFGVPNGHITVTKVLSAKEAVATVTVDAGDVGGALEQRGLNLTRSTGGGATCDCQMLIGDATTPVATISGRVTDQSDHPVAFAKVWVEQPDPNNSLGFDVHAYTTGADGRYTADGLAPGTYTVVFLGTEQLAGQWWNGQSAANKAKSLTLAAGQVRTNVNASLSGRGQIKVKALAPRYESGSTVAFDLTGNGLSPIRGDFRVSVKYYWGLLPLQTSYVSDSVLHATGYVYGSGTYDIVTEWTAADGTTKSSTCTGCLEVLDALQVYPGGSTSLPRGATTTVQLTGAGLSHLSSITLAGTGANVKSWVLNGDGTVSVVITVKSNASVGSRTLTVRRADGATATVDLQVT